MSVTTRLLLSCKARDGSSFVTAIAMAKQRTPRILLCHGNQALLLLDGTQGAVECGEPLFHGVVEDVTESRRVVATRGPDIQMRALFGGSHRTILASGVDKWRFEQRRACALWSALAALELD